MRALAVEPEKSSPSRDSALSSDDDDEIGALQDRGIDLLRGRKIGAKESLETGRRPGNHFGGNLELADQRICRPERQCVGVHGGIGARCNHDLVLAGWRHANQRDPRRSIGQDLQVREVHTVLAQKC